ncbi:MAG: undecaprenyl/decaprenyl-phosphate alpha-N-acetylglucosaminyl 1-phosphate transferase [Peptococcaceae bacterium]|nr:undecaprenyl/decaprenyl-phosphate alpha-N-acetylglucosaminyl 1-phosphate transferase [Peptococcaceae bacterium]
MAYIIPCGLAFLLSVAMTPLAIRLAKKWGVLDEPGERRVHRRAVPRLGGIALFASFWIGVLIMWQIDLLPDLSEGVEWTRMIWGLFWGSSLIFVLGLIDDIWGVHPVPKLITQIVAACIPLQFGLSLTFVTLPVLGRVELGIWGSVLAVVWIVGIVNTVNVTDGLDGLASGICIIASLTLAWSAFLIGQGIATQMMMILAAAALGFLFFNYHPAKIFMGDSGSTFLGYVLGTVSIGATLKTPTVLGLVFPLLVLGVPFLDILFAVIRRSWKGRSIMKADRGHLHHRLLDSGLTHSQAVWTLYLISLCFGVMAICSVSDVWYLWVLAAILFVLAVVLVVLIMFRKFSLVRKLAFFFRKKGKEETNLETALEQTYIVDEHGNKTKLQKKDCRDNDIC